MAPEKKVQQQLEDIKLFIQYAVPEAELPGAIELVETYSKNASLMRLFLEYYSTLPEAREEAIVRVARLVESEGVQLVVVSTVNFSYLYALSAGTVLLLGEYLQEIPREVVSFFGYKSQQEFLKICPAVTELKEYEKDEKACCPVCLVTEGEYHLLGCTVEICPWCEGQLSNCNCRFEQLKVDDITDDVQLEKFFDLLTAKGRVVYKKSQAPAYPGTSNGLDDKQPT